MRHKSLYTYHDIADAKIDRDRWKRQGIPEAIWCQGKTMTQIRHIIKSLLSSSGPILLTHADKKIYTTTRRIIADATWHEKARMVVIRPLHNDTKSAGIAVVTAGTADIPVGEQAAVTAEAMGLPVKRIYDVGVAGLHRLLLNTEHLRRAACIIVCAGMEGALASVVGGLVSVPVIGVPTSVGYGASFNGIAPMLTMLNSCSPNVSIVNINNGFGAGIMGSLIAGSRKART
ncbi:MAG: nickel pincer cofactor biosynthesis protein LarB [Elusimicrobia bacterium]|nr:nickel pincer cofactor biosynthesis protein LarB [Elusimicrobiota bacterium]MBD3411894.1 nickel pincer cofactor biosynthesis protein LarB [Elusimicrobiota bacterium]